jgi:hypothetical protein
MWIERQGVSESAVRMGEGFAVRLQDALGSIRRLLSADHALLGELEDLHARQKIRFKQLAQARPPGR